VAQEWQTVGGTSPRAIEQRLCDAAEGGGDSLRTRLRLALAELLRLVEQEPGVARELLAGSQGGGEEAALRREETMERLLARLQETTARWPPSGPPPSPLAAAAVIGGVERVLQTRLREAGPGRLRELLPSLVYIAALHMEGPGAAREAQAECEAGAVGREDIRG